MFLTLECKISIFDSNMGIIRVTILCKRMCIYADMHLIAECVALPGLGLQTDPLNPLKPIPLGRAMAREQESPTAACTFRQTSSPTITLQMRGGAMGADGLTPQGVRAHPFASSLLLYSFTAREEFILFYCFWLYPLINPSTSATGVLTRRAFQRCKSSPECLFECQQCFFCR